MAFFSALKSFPRMFNRHVFRMPKITQQNKTLFTIWKSFIGDFRETPGKRHILTDTGPQSKILPIDVHPQVLGENKLCNKLAGFVVTRGLAGGRSDDQDAPRRADSHVKETEVVKSGEDYERAKRLMGRLLRANEKWYTDPLRMYRFLVTKSRGLIGYVNFTNRVVVVSVGVMRVLNDDELMVVFGHLLALIPILDAANAASCHEPVPRTTFEMVALSTFVGLHLSCLVCSVDLCTRVLFLDAMATILFAGWWAIDSTWADARVLLSTWKNMYAADRVGLQMAVRAGAPVTAGSAMLQKFDEIARKHNGCSTWIPSTKRLASWYRLRKMHQTEASLTK